MNLQTFSPEKEKQVGRRKAICSCAIDQTRCAFKGIFSIWYNLSSINSTCGIMLLYLFTTPIIFIWSSISPPKSSDDRSWTIHLFCICHVTNEWKLMIWTNKLNDVSHNIYLFGLSTIKPRLVECCSDGCSSVSFFHLHIWSLELKFSVHQVLGHLSV